MFDLDDVKNFTAGRVPSGPPRIKPGMLVAYASEFYPVGLVVLIRQDGNGGWVDTIAHEKGIAEVHESALTRITRSKSEARRTLRLVGA